MLQLVHYFRMVGQPTLKAARMVERVLRDLKPDGGWNIKEPDTTIYIVKGCEAAPQGFEPWPRGF